MLAQKGLALPRASHSSEIALSACVASVLCLWQSQSFSRTLLQRSAKTINITPLFTLYCCLHAQSLRSEEDSWRESTTAASATLDASERAWQSASRANTAAQQSATALVEMMSRLTEEMAAVKRAAAARARAARPGECCAVLCFMRMRMHACVCAVLCCVTLCCDVL